MTLTLVRIDLSHTRTIGRLLVDGVFECWTLEDAVRPDGVKIAGETAIPAGHYEVQLTVSGRAAAGTLWSPRPDHKLPLLLRVPMFDGIRMHAGNTALDTLGCILLGQARGHDTLERARAALISFLPKLEAGLATGSVWISIGTGELA
jgi:uncharacterized protein DUF5675